MKFVSNQVFSAISRAFANGKKAEANARAKEDQAIQQMLDGMMIACDKPKKEFMKGNARTNAAKAEVKSVFDSIVEAGNLADASAKTYQTCFWIAFETGVPFSRDLHNQKSKAKKSDNKTTSKTKSGGIESTDRAALDKTICKALKQARLLGLNEFAAEMLDLALESLDGFTESVE